jgi:diaminopimelate decarboxylase
VIKRKKARAQAVKESSLEKVAKAYKKWQEVISDARVKKAYREWQKAMSDWKADYEKWRRKRESPCNRRPSR